MQRGARLLVFSLALVWIVSLGEFFRGEAKQGTYFHAWTSEYMMQTLPLGDLRREPVKSLWYDHIQPPVFDALRAGLSRLYPTAESTDLIRKVDFALIRVFALIYAASATLVFAWLELLGGRPTAVAGTLLFLFLPGPIFYAFYLDSTLLSSVLILWFFFELWRVFADGRSSTRAITSGALLVLTRSVFQWPFVLLLAVSTWAMSRRNSGPRRQGLRLVVALGVVVGLYVAKQYSLFGLTVTSSFGPDSFCKGLSEYCHGSAKVDLPEFTSSFNAVVLRRAEKLNGEYNYNQMAFLKRSFSQMAEYRALLRRLTLSRVAEILRTNAEFYWRPTSSHSPHALVDRLPWRRAMDAATSRIALLGWLLLATFGWARRCARASNDALRTELHFGFGFALPALYIAAVTIVFESGENMRYRFFLEPLILVFVVAQIHTFLSSNAKSTA